jgi:cytidylate kinase
MIIAIDGPSASGKGTLAKMLAKHYGLPHLDTGALYRAITYKLLQAGFTVNDTAEAIRIAKDFGKAIDTDLLASPELRSEIISSSASPIAAIPEVRSHLFDLQKQFATQPGGAVIEGRDIATVIAPQAEVKLYVTATPEKRAQRRLKELQSRGQTATYEAVLQDLHARDARDSSRSVAPAIQAVDATLLDNSELNVEQAFEAALRIVKAKTGKA